MFCALPGIWFGILRGITFIGIISNVSVCSCVSYLDEMFRGKILLFYVYFLSVFGEYVNELISVQ